MNTQSKDFISKWMPVLIALCGFAANAMYLGRWIGDLESKQVAFAKHIDSLEQHRPLASDIKTFVTRPEFDSLRASRDLEINELRFGLRNIDGKLDRLIERSSKNGGQ